jgi:hypothetical protein
MTRLRPTLLHSSALEWEHCRPGCVPTILVCLLSTCLLAAQPLPYAAEPLSQPPAFRYYVWGQVHAPGAYRLSANPDVIELLSAAGGPTEQADMTRVVLVRGSDQQQVRIDLKRQLGNGRPPTLSPGDVVIIPRSLWSSIRNELAVVTALAVFANLVLTIINGVSQ